MFGYTIARCHACGGGIRLTVAAPWCLVCMRPFCNWCLTVSRGVANCRECTTARRDLEVGAGISDAEERRIVRLIERDVAATVSTDCHNLIAEAAARLRLFCDLNDFCDRVVDEVQQRLHDEFIDTTWPACPLHPNHPLWFGGGSWSCAESGREVAVLGQLPRRA